MSTVARLPIELRLILACLRVSPRHQEIDRIRALVRDDIDWAAFSTWLERHRALPLVYIHLRQFAWPSVPASIRQDLHRKFTANTLRTMACAGELVRVLKLLDKHGIDGLPFKGIIAALQIYGDLTLRQAGDMDILVDPDHIKRADQILCNNGYRHAGDDYSNLNTRQAGVLQQVIHHYKYIACNKRITLELHWRLAGNKTLFSVDFGTLLQRAQTQPVAGYAARTLASDDMALYLFMHGANHTWNRLSWLADIATLLRQGPYNWPDMMDRATGLGQERTLVQGTLLAHDLLGSPIDPSIQAYAARNRTIKSLYRTALLHIVHPTPLSLSLAEIVHSRLVYQPMLHRSLRYKFDHFIRLCVNVEDWRVLPLPNALFPLYFLLRPLFWCLRRMRWL